MTRSSLILICLLTLASPTVAEDVSVGDTVLANWKVVEGGKQVDAYFIGTAVEKKANGFLIIFEDGDIAVVPEAKVRKNGIKVGSRVLARWDDGAYYPGNVAQLVGRALYIHYSDGDKRWVPWSWIAVR